MSRRNRFGTTIGAAISATLVIAAAATPAGAADSAAHTDPPTFELIVSEEVAEGEAPNFSIVETDLAGLVKVLEERGDERVEWNGTAQLTWQPRDPSYLLDRGEQQEGLEIAWDVTRGAADVVIAVIDSGVNPSSELDGRLLDGISMIDGDPHVDTFGHGSAVALVAAAAHDGVGVAGVCPSCSILPVQVATEDGSVPWAAAADGIVWAVDNGADILNLSFGSRGAPRVVEEAVAYAIANDVVVVASAGNFGDDVPFYPAAFDGVIAVGGADESLARYPWSSFGPWVDVAAPGCARGIHGPDTIGCGTSFAAPWIAGVSGLLAAEYGRVGPAATKAAIAAATSPLSWVETGWVLAGELFGPRFLDVEPDSYYAEPVTWLVDQNITTGTSPTTYDPDAPVTRAQLATFLWRLAAV